MGLVHIEDILVDYFQIFLLTVILWKSNNESTETLQSIILTDLLTAESGKTLSTRFNFISLKFKPIIFSIDCNPSSWAL